MGLPIRVGMTTAVIFTGIVGNEVRCEYTLMGDGVNLAARLMQASQPNQLLIHRSTKDGARHQAFQSLGTLQVKGKKEPVEVFTLGEGYQEEEELFVGREREREEVLHFLSQNQGKTTILQIVGPSGIGKSAFIKALMKAWERQKIFVAYSEEYGAQTPYFLIQPLLLKLLEERSSDKSLAKGWEAYLKDKAPELLPFAFLLLDLLHIPHKLSRPPGDPETLKAILFKEITLLFSNLSSPHGIVLENCQWQDEASWEVLTHLFRILQEEPIAFILVTREERQLPPSVISKTLTLMPFTKRDVQTFLTQYFQTPRLPEGLDHTLYQDSQGNPLLLKETLKLYRDAGYIFQDPQREIVLVDETKKPQLPATLEGLILARIDPLKPESQYILKALSVVGQKIRKTWEEPLLKSFHIAPRALKKVLKLGKFLTRQPEGDLAFPEKHLQSTLYESLDYETRRTLHRKIAGVLEEILKSTDPTKPSLLAHHYLQGRAYREGYPWIIQEVQKAVASYAFPTALQLVLPLLKKGELPPKKWTEAALFAGDLLLKRGMFPEVVKILGDLSKAQGEEKARLFKLKGDALRQMGHFEEAYQTLKAGENLSQDPETHFGIGLSLATLEAQRGNFPEALRKVEALEKAYKNQVSLLSWQSLQSLKGPLLFVLGEHKRAFETLKKLKDVMLKNKQYYGAIKILHNLGTFYLQQGHRGKSLHSYTLSWSIQKKYGFCLFQGLTLNEIGTNKMVLGQWQKAFYDFQEGESIAEKYDDPFKISIMCNLSEIFQYVAYFKEAKMLLHEANKISIEKNYKRSLVLFYYVEYYNFIYDILYLYKAIHALKDQAQKEKAGYLSLLIQGYEAWGEYH